MYSQSRLLFWSFFMGHALYSGIVTADSRIDCPGRGEVNQSQDITCILTAPISSGLTWTRPDAIPVAVCNTANVCVPNVGYNVTVHSATNFTLHIDRIQKRDAGSWQCRDTGNLDPHCSLTVFSADMCTITESNSKLTVDLRQYCCSENTSFQLQSDDGTSYNLLLANTSVSVELRDNTGTCQVPSTFQGTLYPVMSCGNFTAKMSCSIDINPIPGTTLSPTTTTVPPVPPCECLPCLIVAAILAGLVIIFILLLCICGAAGAAGAAAGAAGGSNSAADRGNVGGKCFKCREDNHKAKTCKAPDKGKSRKLETTVSDLDDETIKMNLKKHLKTMEIKHIQIDMELGIITVEEREYAQFNIAKKQSQIEIYLYWKDEKMETHHLIFEKKESNKKSDPWRLALFIVSIILIIASLACLIYPLVGCLPLEGQCVGSVVVSGLGIPLGIIGLLLCFCWRTVDGCPWLCCCCIGGYSLANDGNEMREQRSP